MSNMEGFGRRHAQTDPDCFFQTMRPDENLPAFVRVGQRLKIGEFQTSQSRNQKDSLQSAGRAGNLIFGGAPAKYSSLFVRECLWQTKKGWIFCCSPARAGFAKIYSQKTF